MPAHDIIPIARRLERKLIIVSVTAEGDIGQFSAVGSHLDYPVIIAALRVLRLITTDSRRRQAPQQIIAITGWVDGIQIVYFIAPKYLFPQLRASPIYFDDPLI
jgi:hypothetical protein